MEQYNQKILSCLTQYLLDHPDVRFGQALFEIGINKFANQMNPGAEKYLLQDISCDDNKKIYERLNKNK